MTFNRTKRNLISRRIKQVL